MNKKIIAIIGGIAAGIFGLGAYIYNQPSLYGVSSVGIEEMEKWQTNSQFVPYIDKDLTSTELKQLIDIINSLEENNPITYNGPTKNKVESGKHYYAKEEYDDRGRINKITVNEVVQ